MRGKGLGVAGLKTTYLITYTSSGIPSSLHTDTPEETAASLKRLKLVTDVVVHPIEYREIPDDRTARKKA
jgi:hypothetical protein